MEQQIQHGVFPQTDMQKDTERFLRHTAELREKIKKDKNVGRQLLERIAIITEDGELIPRRDI